MVHIATADLHLAGAAQAVAAGVRQVDALAQRRVEQGLPLLHVDGGAQGLDGELVAHGMPRLRRTSPRCP